MYGAVCGLRRAAFTLTPLTVPRSNCLSLQCVNLFSYLQLGFCVALPVRALHTLGKVLRPLPFVDCSLPVRLSTEAVPVDLTKPAGPCSAPELVTAATLQALGSGSQCEWRSRTVLVFLLPPATAVAGGEAVVFVPGALLRADSSSPLFALAEGVSSVAPRRSPPSAVAARMDATGSSVVSVLSTCDGT
jgi:hypothetical protein